MTEWRLLKVCPCYSETDSVSTSCVQACVYMCVCVWEGEACVWIQHDTIYWGRENITMPEWVLQHLITAGWLWLARPGKYWLYLLQPRKAMHSPSVCKAKPPGGPVSEPWSLGSRHATLFSSYGNLQAIFPPFLWAKILRLKCTIWVGNAFGVKDLSHVYVFQA